MTKRAKYWSRITTHAGLNAKSKSRIFHRDMWALKHARAVFERELIARTALRMARQALLFQPQTLLPESTTTLADPLAAKGRLGWRRTSLWTGVLWSVGTEGSYRGGPPPATKKLLDRDAPEGTILRFKVQIPRR